MPLASPSVDWIKRPFVDEDEPCLVSMWLHSYCRSRDVGSSGFDGAEVPGSAAQIRYWRIHQPIVTALIRTADVDVICDPMRSEHTPGSPAIIWAWACFDSSAAGDRVHYVGVKRSAARAGLARELVADLLGDRIGRACSLTFDPVDLRHADLIPPMWKSLPKFLSSLRAMSTYMASADPIYAAVGAHVLDIRRRGWEPAR